MAIAEKWDLPCTRIGIVTDDDLWRVLEDGEEVCRIPVAALVDEVPRYVREVGRAALPGGAPCPHAGLRGDRPRGSADRARDTPLRAHDREQALGLGAVRPPRPDEHHPRARARRGGPPPHKGDAGRARGLDRRQRPIRVLRPAARRGAGRRGGGPQPGHRRRPPAGGDRLPELRQSREGRGILPVRRGRAWDRGGLPGARRARRQRKRFLLQRVPQGGHLSDADDRDGGTSRGRRDPAARGRLAGRLPRR